MMNYLQKFSLKGKVAFVTGGAGLIGAEAAKALASVGAHAVILDIDKKKGKKVESEISRCGYRASFEYFDITNLRGMESKVKALVKKYKRLDVWVNSAYPRTKDWALDAERLNINSLRQNVDMQLNAHVWSSRVVALAMKRLKTKGSIINFGSIYGVQGNDFTIYEKTGITSPMAYAAIKGGIVNLTRYLAAYFGPGGIRVNTVCPGGVFDKQNKRFVKNYSHKVPLKRMANTEEIASVVVFLACEASSYITGSTVMVDGGWTIV